jgi:hypothetical protein
MSPALPPEGANSHLEENGRRPEGAPVTKERAQVLPFNPLDKMNLGSSVAEALISAKAHPLDNIPAFNGVGIYAIYYCGPFKAYKLISAANKDKLAQQVPIYVGKAVPAGARKGHVLADALQSKSLSKRLAEHAESIRWAKNLDIGDFMCRYLIVDEIWIPLGESLMIAKFAPLWNAIVDGFGNHDPGQGQYQGLRPRWDVLHPGRPWAMKCKERTESDADILRDAHSYLSNISLPTSAHFIGADSE